MRMLLVTPIEATLLQLWLIAFVWQKMLASRCFSNFFLLVVWVQSLLLVPGYKTLPPLITFTLPKQHRIWALTKKVKWKIKFTSLVVLLSFGRIWNEALSWSCWRDFHIQFPSVIFLNFTTYPVWEPSVIPLVLFLLLRCIIFCFYYSLLIYF